MPDYSQRARPGSLPVLCGEIKYLFQSWLISSGQLQRYARLIGLRLSSMAAGNQLM